MSSFTHEESEIIRDADMDGSLKDYSPAVYINLMVESALDLRDSPSFVDAGKEIGKLGQSLILLCASLDLDLTTCIRKARKQ